MMTPVSEVVDDGTPAILRGVHGVPLALSPASITKDAVTAVDSRALIHASLGLWFRKRSRNKKENNISSPTRVVVFTGELGVTAATMRSGSGRPFTDLR
jgi:hypothetical protein